MYLYLYDDEILMASSVPIVSDLHKEITRAEYDEIADEMGLPHYVSPEEQYQQQVVERQAELLNLRATADEEDLIWIEEELEEISDYWDSLEGTVATYAE